MNNYVDGEAVAVSQSATTKKKPKVILIVGFRNSHDREFYSGFNINGFKRTPEEVIGVLRDTESTQNRSLTRDLLFLGRIARYVLRAVATVDKGTEWANTRVCELRRRHDLTSDQLITAFLAEIIGVRRARYETKVAAQTAIKNEWGAEQIYYLDLRDGFDGVVPILYHDVRWL